MSVERAFSSTPVYSGFTGVDGAALARERLSMAEGKMTADEFDALQPRLGRLTVDTVKIARTVLVDGVRPVDAATQYGTSRQRVNAIIRRFEEATREFPTDWRRVDVWLPPELAARVEQMAQEARAAYAGGAKGSSGSPT